MHFNMTDETDFKEIKIDDLTIDTIKRITLEDIHAFISFLMLTQLRTWKLQNWIKDYLNIFL